MNWIERTILVVFCTIAFAACEREFVFRGGEEGLTFSADTLMFDTIFTSIGSTTKNFRVYNPYSEDMAIESIELAGGDDSDFRLNIDGSSDNYAEDVRIRSRDSLYIFVEVTIDPVGSNTPYVVTDSIYFRTKNKVQTVQLVAYGQDVILMRKEWLNSQTLTNEKPYLIYDYIVVDSAQTVNIDPGARLYFYKDASMLVLGTLHVNGSIEEPVVFAGHRQEDWYADKPGQWGYIHLLPGSGQSTINNCIIKNGMMGILADSVGLNDTPITINNTKIEHISTFGLLAQTSNLNVSNSVFGDCGNSSAALTVGGNYQFTHCTFANYFDWTYRSNPAVFLNNYYIDQNDKEQIIPLKEATFNNCIIYGNSVSEIGFDLKYNNAEFPEIDASYQFNHAIIKAQGDFDISDNSKFINVQLNVDPSFINIPDYNYQLDTLSAAKDIGSYGLAEPYPIDIHGVNRLQDDGPDLGAYERYEKK
ncbi:hypothetical protein KDU71_17185 [Carboxylicivirga sediminis]|uniref:Right handed beta helix domain-containing protein n=1 Tax=Carboxylicivirga sediminis TaxID=2006564 RepID=A0A941F5R2_9BACT|nr:hypothetical protein [Carboxylicivirga sediminis]MBR8537306.1 hypothetical protein [Carboxylicivirga sediminis]